MEDKPQKIAVINAQRVLRDMVEMRKGREELAQQRQTAERRIHRDRDEILKLEEQLGNVKPDGEDFRRIEQEIATRRADLQVLIELQEKDFRRTEGKMINAALERLETAVAAWARENGVVAVLRVEPRPDPLDLDAVSRAVARQVFYHVDAIDITNPMLTRLNEQAMKEKKPDSAWGPQSR